jgi:sugar fermentation stimulation protein A
MVEGTFVARPQRFLVDAQLENGSRTTAYCANPGSFRTEFRPGCPILLWASPDRTRKRAHTWRAIKHGRTWIGTDTHLANLLVERALEENRIPSLRGFTIAQKEPRGALGRRLDFLLVKGARRCFVEVKSAMAAQDGCAQFPDSQSPRACAHLADLTAHAVAGHRAIVVFLVQRGDVVALRINDAFDSAFTSAYQLARNHGVEALAIKHAVTRRGFGPPVVMPVQSLRTRPQK